MKYLLRQSGSKSKRNKEKCEDYKTSADGNKTGYSFAPHPPPHGDTGAYPNEYGKANKVDDESP